MKWGGRLFATSVLDHAGSKTGIAYQPAETRTARLTVEPAGPRAWLVASLLPS